MHTDAGPDLLEPPAVPPPPRQEPANEHRLRRSRTRRMLGGVAGGLAERYDVDVALVRVAFVVLACAWGAGLVVYLALWALVPAAPSDGATATEDEPALTWLSGLVLLGVVVLGLVLASALWGGPGFGGGIGLAWVVLLGVLVLVALGRPRRGGTSVLRVLAVLALCALTAVIVAVGALLGVVAATGVPLSGGVGDHVFQPVSLTQVRPVYRTAVGSLTVDLTHVHFGESTRHVTATVGVGQVTVEVPPGVVVSVSAHSGLGNVTAVPDMTSLAGASGTGAHPQLVLTAEAGVGQVRLVRASPGTPL
jgi:phage shock protein PspC (stress-responsive transcriptional regulator)